MVKNIRLKDEQNLDRNVDEVYCTIPPDLISILDNDLKSIDGLVKIASRFVFLTTTLI